MAHGPGASWHVCELGRQGLQLLFTKSIMSLCLEEADSNKVWNCQAAWGICSSQSQSCCCWIILSWGNSTFSNIHNRTWATCRYADKFCKVSCTIAFCTSRSHVLTLLLELCPLLRLCITCNLRPCVACGTWTMRRKQEEFPPATQSLSRAQVCWTFVESQLNMHLCGVAWPSKYLEALYDVLPWKEAACKSGMWVWCGSCWNRLTFCESF